MVDKITTIPKTNLGSRLGRLDEQDIVRLNRAMLVFLGVASKTARSAVSIQVLSLTVAVNGKG